MLYPHIQLEAPSINSWFPTCEDLTPKLSTFLVSQFDKLRVETKFRKWSNLDSTFKAETDEIVNVAFLKQVREALLEVKRMAGDKQESH